MIIINWNIGYISDFSKIFSKINELINNNTSLIMIEECAHEKYKKLKDLIINKYNYEYSLNYRIPGKYDKNNRKLGILFLCTKDVIIEETKVLDRTLFPDRTLYVKVNVNGKHLKIVGIHSVTGCSYGRAKSTQYYSLTEEIEMVNPDILCIDANEPKKDHYEISSMEFFMQNGERKETGAKCFFEKLNELNLVDSYAQIYDKNKFVNGEPLITSHIINKTKNVRYDFVFVKKAMLCVNDVVYNIEDSKKSSADHSYVLANVDYREICER